MTDRELLEAAARAAGLRIECDADKAVVFPSHYSGGFSVFNDRGGSSLWNPLTDDGDALRLAVKLGIHISPDCEHESAKREARAATPGASHLLRELHNGDPAAATRRAVVRAAAAMVKEG